MSQKSKKSRDGPRIERLDSHEEGKGTIWMRPEMYKMCCPRCSLVYFRLTSEDLACPRCLCEKEEVQGVIVAGGHFVVDHMLRDLRKILDPIDLARTGGQITKES